MSNSIEINLKTEASVLGNCLQSKNSLLMTMSLLNEDCFYKSEHKIIFAQIKKLFDSDKAVDILTVINGLRSEQKLKEVGLPTVSALTQHLTNEALMESHCLILKQQNMSRMQTGFAYELLNMSEKGKDVFEINDYMAEMVHNIAKEGQLKAQISNHDLAVQLTKKIEEASQQRGITGMATGFHEIDKLFGGMQRSELIVQAARPGMGKTALMICQAINMVLNYKKRVLIASQEMSALQMFSRMASIVTDISGNKLKSGDLTQDEWERYHSMIGQLINENIVIVDDAYHIHQIRTRAKQEKLDKGIDCLFVDYIQITNGEGQNRDAQIGYVTRNLKMLSKELDIPVVALAQLSRALENRSDKRPKLNDLRESGAIEQDADIVAFVHRPSYYDETEPRDLAYYLVSKHRNGGLKDIELRFIHEKTQFINPETKF